MEVTPSGHWSWRVGDQRSSASSPGANWRPAERASLAARDLVSRNSAWAWATTVARATEYTPKLRSPTKSHWSQERFSSKALRACSLSLSEPIALADRKSVVGKRVHLG